MKKGLITLAIIATCLTTGVLLASDSSAAKKATGNKGATGTVALNRCPSINSESGNYPSACAKNMVTYGGASWRYYELTTADKNSNNSIKLTSLNGTGGEAEIFGCNKVGGFYFYGYEVYNAKSGQNGASMGYNVPSVNHNSLAAGTVKLFTGTPKNDQTVHGAGLAASGRKHTFAKITWKSDAEAKAAFQRAIDEDGQQWSGDWNTMNLSYFCSSSEEDNTPKSSSTTGSTTATANGSSQTAGPTSSQAVGKLLKVSLPATGSPQTVSVTFSHKINISGNDKGKTVSWHTSTPDKTSGDQSGSITLDNTDSGNSKTTNPITVNITLGDGESQETCSTLFFGEGDASYAKQCARITVGPGLPPEEETYVATFDGDSSVKAKEDICVTNVDELSDIIIEDESRCPGGGIVPTGTDITGRSLRIFVENEGEKTDLHFDHTVSRTDNQPNCKVNNFITQLPVSQGMPLNGDAKSIRDALTDKSNWGTAAKNFFSNVDSLGLDPVEFGIGESKSYSADASVEITPTASLYCQVVSYIPTRLVNDQCRSGWEKDLKDGAGMAGEAAKYVWNNTSEGEDIFQTILNAVGSFFQWVADNSQTIMDYIFRLFKHGAKEVKGFVNNFMENEAAGLTYACTTLQQDLNYDLTPFTSITNDVAIVGETIGVDLDKSGVKSVPEHDGPLTPTGPFRLKVVTFPASESVVLDLQGDYEGVTVSGDDICEYFRPKIGGYSANCHEVARKDNLQIIPPSAGYNEATKSFQDLGIGPISITVDGQLSTSDYVCVAAGVQDPDSSSYFKERGKYWAISGATCRKVAKKPSLNITGGSVYSGNEIKTSLTESGRTNGSWVEYGAIAKGKIPFDDRTGFASGRNLIGGLNGVDVDPPEYNHLTISNNSTDPKKELGNSSVSLSIENLKYNIQKAFKEKAAQGSPITGGSLPTSCNESDEVCYYYNADDLYLSTSGKVEDTHIIYAEGDVIIESDLEYADANGNEIPQIVIISDGNIKINSNVKTVDAWLITTDGLLETCNGAAVGFFAEDDCNVKLTINGPVITKGQNQNYRTNGASVASGDDTSDPAEVFNLPASAYIWSYFMAAKDADRFYQTYVTELAPRY